MSVERITITLDPLTLKKIESSRGLISRSRYIESILQQSLELQVKK